MPIQKLILASLIFAFALIGTVLAADKPVTQADVEKLQDQVRTLEKELAVQREAFVRKLDDVEKRQTDNTAKDANSLTAISNQTTTLGNYIAYTSAAITVFVFIAGIATYFSAKSKAEKEARAASKQWFDQNALDLKAEIKNLRAAVLDAIEEIKLWVAQFQADTNVESDKVIAITEAARTLLKTAEITTGDEPTDATNRQAVTTVQDAREALQNKPESEFNAADFYASGLAYLSEKNYQSAVTAFESAYNFLVDTDPVIRRAEYLFAQSRALAALKNDDKTIPIYDLLFEKFSGETNLQVRNYVATSLLKKGLLLKDQREKEKARQTFVKLAENFRTDTDARIRKLVSSGLTVQGFLTEHNPDAIAIFDQVIEQFQDDDDVEVRPEVARAYVNKSYRLLDEGRLSEVSDVCQGLEDWSAAATEPAVMEQVAKGLHHKALAQIFTARQKKTPVSKRIAMLKSALSTLQNALAKCAPNYKYKILCSLGYALFLAEKEEKSRTVLEECLDTFKQNAFSKLTEYAKDPEAYEAKQFNAVLNEVWIKVSKEASPQN